MYEKNYLNKLSFLNLILLENPNCTFLLNKSNHKSYDIPPLCEYPIRGINPRFVPLLEIDAPEVKVVAMCANVPDAVIAINQHKPAVVFLGV